MENKQWFKSKTLWLNIVAILLVVVQSNTGFLFPLEYQATIVAVLNLITRSLTTTNITVTNTEAK